MMTARLLLCLAAASAVTAQQNPMDTGPTTLVIQYRCLPNQRIALRNFMRGQGLHQLEAWRGNSLLAGYRVLFSRYVDTNNWDMLLILSFPDCDALAKWRLIEHRSAAGLPDGVLAWSTAVNTYPVDLVRWRATETAPKQPVYYVAPYADVFGPQSLQYFNDYVQPECEGLMQTSPLGRYEFYVQRYGPHRPWGGLLVVQYNDDASLGEREKTLAKIAGLRTDSPEREPVLADELAITR